MDIKPEPESLAQPQIIPQEQRPMQIVTSMPQNMDLGDLQYANAHGFLQSRFGLCSS